MNGLLFAAFCPERLRAALPVGIKAAGGMVSE
jgi:hypothetical protein